MYRRGHVVTQNWKLAIRWYLRAAAGGTTTAMYWLGRIYGGLENYPADREKAFHWLSLAAENGDEESQCSLGVCYFNGHGVPVDKVAAASWYRLAARQGDAWACYLLGLCYRDGTGVSRNRSLARIWFQKAISLKVKEARAALDALDNSRSHKTLTPTEHKSAG